MFAIGSLTKAFSATADQLRAHVAAQPAGDFRRGQGNAANLSYSLLGQVLASASGQSWDDALAARQLQPLGMTATVSTRAAAVARGSVAEGHVFDLTEVVEAPGFEPGASSAQGWVRNSGAFGVRDVREMLLAAFGAEAVRDVRGAVRADVGLDLLPVASVAPNSVAPRADWQHPIGQVEANRRCSPADARGTTAGVPGSS